MVGQLALSEFRPVHFPRTANVNLQQHEYRADIDGLRAIAVVLVLMFHVAPGIVPGGFVGVDVFFVISGFLITQNILRDIDAGRFTILRFYAARVRRIYPALITVLLATLGAGWLLLQAHTYQEVGKEVLFSSVFSANLYFWFTTNYFNQSAENVLLHLWSLGVEEQFYIVWPLLLISLAKLPKIIGLPLAILAVSLAWNVYLAHQAPTEAFFSPLCRAWELMVGAMLAFHRTTMGRAAGAFAAVGSLAAIAAVSFFPGKLALFGLPTLIPVMASALILVSRNSWVNGTILSSEPFRQTGLISYPLYLWHWPVLAILQFRNFGHTPPLIKIVALIAAYGLAWLTHKLIERPWLKRYPLALVGAMAGVGAIGAFVSIDGLPDRPVKNDVRRAFVERYDILHRYGLAKQYGFQCDFYDNATFRAKSSIPASCTATDRKPAIILWGDSHAQALSSGLRAVVPSSYATVLLASSGCRPSIQKIEEVRDPIAEACARSQRNALAAITRIKPRILIIAQAQGHERTDWNEVARWAHAHGTANVVLIGPLPQWWPSLPGIVAKSYWQRDRSRVNEGLEPTIFSTDRLLAERYTDSTELRYVSMVGALCDKTGCLATVPDSSQIDLMAVDYGHLSAAGSQYVGRNILQPIIGNYLR